MFPTNFVNFYKAGYIIKGAKMEYLHNKIAIINKIYVDSHDTIYVQYTFDKNNNVFNKDLKCVNTIENIINDNNWIIHSLINNKIKICHKNKPLMN